MLIGECSERMGLEIVRILMDTSVGPMMLLRVDFLFYVGTDMRCTKKDSRRCCYFVRNVSHVEIYVKVTDRRVQIDGTLTPRIH